MFSRKGPSSHTFYILYPVSLIYTMYCYQKIFQKPRKYLNLIFIAVLLSGGVFLAGLARYNLIHSSLYYNREVVTRAIEKKDYKLLGNKLTNPWNDGY